MAAYGLGLRVAARVVALSARQVDVTATLLAAAAADEAAERVLLSPELLTSPETLTEESLRRRAEEAGFSQAELLRVIHDGQDGWRTMALEDDVLAESARADGGAPAGEAEGLAMVRTAPRQMSTRETRDLFTPEEVARLKLSALTSQDPDERIEALRKLVFAPMEGAQKAGIFLSVLSDREAGRRIRREAVRAFEQIGFRSDLAEAVRGLFDEDPEDTIYFIQRLGARLRTAERGEAALVLTIVLEVLAQSHDLEMIRELLRLVARSADILVRNYEKSEQFFGAAVRHLERDFEGLRPDVEDAVSACLKKAPGMMADLMWSEIRSSENARVRSVLICLSGPIAQSPERLAELADRAVREILNPRLPESEKARLRYGLVRLGESAARVALALMPNATGAERAELARLLDVLCTESDVSDKIVRDAVTALLDLLKLADSATRREVLRASLLWEARAGEALQEEVAGELLTLMAEFNLPDGFSVIQNALEKIGPPAVAPIFGFMRRAYPGEAAESAARALGHILIEHPGDVPGKMAGRILDFCTSLLEDRELKRGAFVIPMGAICGYSSAGAEFLSATAEKLKSDLWRLPYRMDALDALGIMAGSPNARPEQQEDLCELFDRIVRAQGRPQTGLQRDTDEGRVYEFGNEIEFDTRAVPAAVRGLQRIYTSSQAPADLCRRIASRLLILWEGVSKVRVVWGPVAIQALINAMCSVACSDKADVATRVRLAISLMQFLNKISVIRSIGDICGRPDAASEMQELAIEASGELLDEWDVCAPHDHERKLALLEAVGRIAANSALDAGGEPVRLMRERAVQALFSGLRENMLEVRHVLTELRDCPGLPEAQRRDIRERLDKLFGLVRTRQEA